MIHYITTVNHSWSDVLSAANKLHAISPGSVLIKQPTRLSHLEERKFGELLVKKHNKKPNAKYIVAATSEIAILYLCYAIRQRIFAPSQKIQDVFTDLTIGCVCNRDMDATYNMRVDSFGEFLDIFPDKFFSERMELLF